MSISAFSAAFTACEESGWDLTNLRIQKLLYFAQKAFLGRNRGQTLIDTCFEAWDLGPVVPDLYFNLRQFGNNFVTDIPVGRRNPSLQEHEVIREIVRHFNGVSSGKLVELTHRDGGAWAINYRPGVRGLTIPNVDILAEYENENGITHERRLRPA